MPNSLDQPGGDEIRALLQNELLDRVQLLLKMTSSAGLRLQVPDTDIYILAGKANWIASQIADVVAFGSAQRENNGSTIPAAPSQAAAELRNQALGDAIEEVAKVACTWIDDSNRNTVAPLLNEAIAAISKLKGAEAPATAGQNQQARFPRDLLPHAQHSDDLRLKLAERAQQSAQSEKGGEDA